ncbi:hypothetical protein CMQ_7520 [Grosmannia clavigera kw1407]|uniref:Uncharacterized protein n=1 Tax=Grosmannia clavigera (strain kw1407 / UAMH 11150) TaxID=655863 RepID=F0XQJ2_GROCL|nr:uncharacterized protein CMQ_7520 [Grosmannia clavigera kw1407]EFX00518.1 hypothetical protein CMQ_7520 [Grosmannia clavigera kw1407]
MVSERVGANARAETVSDCAPVFHPWLRGRVQAALTRAWTTRVPVLQYASPAEVAAGVLRQEVLEAVSEDAAIPSRPWIIIDFCAGGGGPTPSIERILNSSSNKSKTTSPTQFVLTDLHPHIDDWAAAAAQSPNVRYAAEPVDASAAEPAAILAAAGLGPETTAAHPRVLRLFNLAFHHFDDPLARAILRNTVETSDGFGILELQDRSVSAFFTTLAFGLGILLTAPYYAWRWRSPMTLVFTYLLPILPFVLVFDGWMSMLRTRTPDEVAALLHSCGATPADVARWELHSGEIRHLWPCGYLKWIVCVKRQECEAVKAVEAVGAVGAVKTTDQSVRHRATIDVKG